MILIKNVTIHGDIQKIIINEYYDNSITNVTKSHKINKICDIMKGKIPAEVYITIIDMKTAREFENKLVIIF